jgi:hypothetical protein
LIKPINFKEKSMQKNLNDLTRNMLAIIFIVLLGALSLQILRPFLPALA